MKIDAKKAVAAIQAIHDLLYWDTDGDKEFYNGSKEWDASLADDISREVGKVIPRPSDYEACDECGALVPQTTGGGLANKHHRDSCSLYDPKEE